MGGGQRGYAGDGGDVRESTGQHPAEAERPPHGGVPADAAPAEDEVGREALAGGEGAEEDEGGGDGVEGELEGEDLGGEAEGGEAGGGAGHLVVRGAGLLLRHWLGGEGGVEMVGVGKGGLLVKGGSCGVARKGYQNRIWSG